MDDFIFKVLLFAIMKKVLIIFIINIESVNSVILKGF